MEKEKLYEKLHNLYIVALILFFFGLACLFVPECDEYYFQYWTFDSLKDLLLTNPRDTGVLLVGIPANGRYLGNLLGILQAKLYASSGGVWMRAAFFAAGSSFLLYLLYGYFRQCSRGMTAVGNLGERRRFHREGFALCAFLLVGAPYGIYSQVLAWGAGYANYVPPVMGLLLIWLLLRRPAGRGDRAVSRIVLFLTAFCSQLFAEPVTVYFLFFGAILLVDGLRRRRRLAGSPSAKAATARVVTTLWVFLGFALGALLMFSDSGYRQVGGDGRAITGENTIRNLAIIASEVVVNHPLTTPLISLLLILALYRGKSRLWWLFTALLLPLNGFVLYSNYMVLTERWFAYKTINIAIGAAIAALWMVMVLLWDSGERPSLAADTSLWDSTKGRIWLWVGSLVIANGPLLVLYPIKSRHFFISYIFLCLIVLELYIWLYGNGQRRKQSELCRKGITGRLPGVVLRLATVACCAGLLFVYSANAQVHQQRMDYANQQIQTGAEEVTLPMLPYTAFVTNEGVSKGDISYVCYREQPWDVKFRFVPWKEWKGYGQ